MGWFFSALECVSASHGAAPDLGLATSVSWVSSSVSGDTADFGPDVVGLATGRSCRLPLTKAKLRLPALDAELIVLTQEHSASRVPVRLLRLWCPLRLRPAVHRFWPVRRSIIRFLCRHALLLLCATTERCWSVRLQFTCHWTPNIVPVTVFPSSMTEQSNFEYVPFSVSGRVCQDDSFVSSVDNSKPQVDPFSFVTPWSYGHQAEFKELAQLELFRCWTPSCTRCGAHCLCPCWRACRILWWTVSRHSSALVSCHLSSFDLHPSPKYVLRWMGGDALDGRCFRPPGEQGNV